MKISVSILNAKNKKETIKILNNTDISYFHIDVMDGYFVSQTSIPVEETIELSRVSEKKLDIHLMHSSPLTYIDQIKDIKNIEYRTMHLEIEDNIKNILNKIREYGFKSGISIKPNTDINKLIPYLNDIDLILIMTVEPGLGGQPFLENSPTRIKEIKKLVKDKNILLEVDGGINDKTIKLLKDVDIAVVGSYITTSDNMIEKVKTLV